MAEQIRSRKTGGAITTLTLATADDSKLTPPSGTQLYIIALSCQASANFSTGNITVQDGATVMAQFVPGATAVTFYQEFSTPLQITTGTNDLRVIITGATSGTLTITVWYQYRM